jgi:phage terminase large subunit-like protein
MLASCVIYADANENIKVHKGRSNGRRVDGIIALINALVALCQRLKKQMNPITTAPMPSLLVNQ